MVNNATDLELKEHNDNAQFASERIAGKIGR